MGFGQEHLVEGAKSGSPDCFGRLYELYYKDMVGIAYAATADRHLAEDVAQETFAIACGSLWQLKDSQKFASWIGAICRNTARQMIRSKKTLPLFEQIPQPPPDCSSEDDRISDFLRQAISLLPDKAREVIVLRYYNQMSYQKISEVLGISETAVHGRLIRAKEQIEKTLRRKGIAGLNNEALCK